MLKLSKKGSYAMKAVIYIAKSEKLVNIVEISESEDISESLLRHVIADLDKGGIIHTIKGRNGGIEIIRDLNTISMYEILDSIGEELGLTDCTKGVFCDKTDDCSTTGFMNNLQTGFNSLLKMYTLDKIIK